MKLWLRKKLLSILLTKNTLCVCVCVHTRGFEACIVVHELFLFSLFSPCMFVGISHSNCKRSVLYHPGSLHLRSFTDRGMETLCPMHTEGPAGTQGSIILSLGCQHPMQTDVLPYDMHHKLVNLSLLECVPCVCVCVCVERSAERMVP